MELEEKQRKLFDIAVVGSKTLVLGMKSAGARVLHEVKNADEGRKKILEVLEQKNVGILVVGESVATDLTEFIEEKNQESVLPSIIVVQDEVLPKHLGSQALETYIEKATGVKIAVQE